MTNDGSLRSAVVVDDDPFLRDVVTELLHQAGVPAVRHCDNGREVVDSLDAGIAAPDLIVADLDMSVMDGLELLRHLTERGYDGSVLLVSGASPDVLATSADLARLHGLHLLGALRKPVSLADITAALSGAQLPTPTPDPVEPSTYSTVLTPEQVRAGMASGCVDIHVQPKVTVVDRRVVGVEALLRWREPSGAVLPPAAILPGAEAGGLLNQLTMTIFALAVDWLALWRRQHHDVRISVNLSNANLTTLALPDAMSAVAQSAGVDASHVTLEITQDGLLEDLSAGMEVVGRLRLKGFGIAIDDYGMGYSSLAQLKNLPVTELKVDRSFVEGANRDDALTEILGSSTTLGRSLGLAVVAQGVETAEVLDLLTALGCDEAQGYLVARPMPPGEFLAWKARWDATWATGGSHAAS